MKIIQQTKNNKHYQNLFPITNQTNNRVFEQQMIFSIYAMNQQSNIKCNSFDQTIINNIQIETIKKKCREIIDTIINIHGIASLNTFMVRKHENKTKWVEIKNQYLGLLKQITVCYIFI